MSITRQSAYFLTGVVVAACLLTGCADKSKSKVDANAPPPSPSTFSKVKDLFKWSSNDAPRATVTTLASDLRGYTFGTAMNTQDLEKLNNVLETGRSRQTTSWVSSSSDKQFGVTPMPPFQDVKSRYCREVTIESMVNGKQESVNTVACRKPDSMWDVQG